MPRAVARPTSYNQSMTLAEFSVQRRFMRITLPPPNWKWKDSKITRMMALSRPIMHSTQLLG